MNKFLTIGFLVVLIGLTLLAVRMWHTRRGASVSEAERRVFARFMLGLGVLWLVAIVAYFAGPLLATIR
jgi:xanthine/uracil permease